MLQVFAVGTKVEGSYYGHPFGGVVSESRRTQDVQRVSLMGGGSAQRMVYGTFHEVTLPAPTEFMGSMRTSLWLSIIESEASQHHLAPASDTCG